MRHDRVPHLMLVVAMVVTPSIGSGNDAPPPVEVHPITDSFHALLCAGQAHIYASTGDDGVLLVDTGYRGTADDVRAALDDLGAGDVRIIVNTHGDGDHVGGNSTLGSGAVIFAHPFVRQQMSSYFALPTSNTAGLPTVTVEAETTIHFNGEEIRLIPVPGGHTGGDLVVHFRGSGVACLGDLVLADILPNADPARGGDAQRLAVNLRRVAEILPADTRVLLTHGRDPERARNATVDDLARAAAVIDSSVAAVRAQLARGRSLAEMQEQQVLARWAELSGRGDVSLDGWTGAVHASITGAAVPSICAPLTETLQSHGVEAAVKLYRQLRAEDPDGYNFAQHQLNTLGYQLLSRGRIDDAIAVFRLNVEAFPDDYDPPDSLGEALLAAGQIEAALASYQRSLDLNPDNTNARAVLERLRRE